MKLKLRTFSLIWILTFFVLLITPNLIIAAPPDPLQGQTCGILNGKPPTNECCRNEAIAKPNVRAPGVFDVVLNAVRGFLDSFTKPAISDIQKQIDINAKACANGVASSKNPNDKSQPCYCIEKALNPDDVFSKLCNPIKNGWEKIRCQQCMQRKDCIWTGIGEVETDVGSFIGGKLLTWGIGVAGGVALLCIMYAAFMMQTSGGNAEQVKKAQQMLTSCITGLMLILFSVFILKLIGVDILKIPGFK